MTRLRIPMISLNYFNYNKQEFSPLNRLYHMTMKIDLLPALVAFIKRYKVTKLFYIIEGEEAFARFQAMMVAQAREKSYDLLDIQVRRLTDIQNHNHTRNLLQSVEIKDRGSKEERYIVLDLSYINSYVSLLMQVGNSTKNKLISFQWIDKYFLRQIRHHGMTTPHYHYILMSLVSDKIFRIERKRNVFFFSFRKPIESICVSFVMVVSM